MQSVYRRTWAHVVRAAAAVAGGVGPLRRQPKVAQINLRAVLITQDILWLEVPVEYPHIVARLDSIENLQEDRLDEHVVSSVRPMLRHKREQISTRAVLQDEEQILILFPHTVYRQYALVERHRQMKADLEMLQIVQPTADF